MHLLDHVRTEPPVTHPSKSGHKRGVEMFYDCLVRTQPQSYFYRNQGPLATVGHPTSIEVRSHEDYDLAPKRPVVHRHALKLYVICASLKITYEGISR